MLHKGGIFFDISPLISACSAGVSPRIPVVAIDDLVEIRINRDRYVLHCTNLLKLVRSYTSLFQLLDGSKISTVKRITNKISTTFKVHKCTLLVSFSIQFSDNVSLSST